MIGRPDLLDDKSPSDLEVYQLTTDKKVPAGHIYMEAQVFTPDSKRLILRAGGKGDSNRYLLCDLDDGGSLRAVIEEAGARGVAVSPDGKFIYYAVHEKELKHTFYFRL